MRKKLPIGIENFEEFSREDFYYADKTMFIAELLRGWGKVNLFTRPRRFGKSLNMSMLKAFFEIGSDRSLFDGLKISREKELCEKHMGKYPVISVTLKSVSGLDYRTACAALRGVIGEEALRFGFLENSEQLSGREREMYRRLTEMENAQDGDLEKGCDKALAQIEEKRYDAVLLRDGMKKVIRYGISFYKKSCRVKKAGDGGLSL